MHSNRMGGAGGSAKRVTVAAAALALAVMACGCQTARVGQPLTANLGGPDPAQRGEFWYQLSRVPLTSNDDAMHALLLYADGTAPATYEQRVAALRERGMLPRGFDGAADEAVARGTLAVAVAKMLDIKGGLTSRLVGPTPRYSTRALIAEGLFPECTPNQAISGAEFAALIGKIEDYQKGDPAEKPAEYLPGEEPPAGLAQMGWQHDEIPLIVETPQTDLSLVDGQLPVLLSMVMQDMAAATPEAPVKLKAIITKVQGELAEVRRDADSPWEPAKAGMVLSENAEIRTGDKSAVQFVIPPKTTYTLDRLGTTRILEAVYDGQKITTNVGMEQGRVRLDSKPLGASATAVTPEVPVFKVEAAGIEHDSTIRSPNSALAVRGTIVSLVDEAGYPVVATSLTGRAEFTNLRRNLVAFGGGGKASVQNDQNSAAEQALAASIIAVSPEIAASQGEALQVATLVARGGFIQGDVNVGDLNVPDAEALAFLPGTLQFVLRWDGGPSRNLNDLNLAVVSPLTTASSPDFVANPPFTVSLVPGDPKAEATRAAKYPRTSRSGGQIGRNSVGPEGLEIASWGRNYPRGAYTVAVYNLVDAVPPPTTTTDPVNYTVDVFLNGEKIIQPVADSVGLLQTDSFQVNVGNEGSIDAERVRAASVSNTLRSLYGKKKR